MASSLRTISIRSAGGGDYTALADETASPMDVISEIKPASKQIVQNEPLYGSETPAVFARGNRGWTLSFSAARVHSTPDAAAEFIRDHAGDIPDLVDIKIVQGAATSYMAAAALESLSFDEPTGIATMTRYSFIGPTFNSTAP